MINYINEKQNLPFISSAAKFCCCLYLICKAGTYTTTVADYQVNIGPGGREVEEPNRLQAQENKPLVVIWSVAIMILSVFLLVTRNGYRGHIHLPFKCRKKSRELKEDRLVLIRVVPTE